jgi:hypothetical protein
MRKGMAERLQGAHHRQAGSEASRRCSRDAGRSVRGALCQHKRILDVDAGITDCALKIGMAK